MLKKLHRSLLVAVMVGLVGAVACSDDDDNGTGPVTDPPGDITDLAVTTNEDEVTLTWTAATDATSHRAELEDGGTTLTETLSGTASTYTFTGLADETEYTARVVAINSAGTSTSNEETITVDFVRSGCAAPADQLDVTKSLRLESSILWDNVSASSSSPDDNFTDASDDGYNLAENKAFFETSGFNNLVANPNLPAAAFNIGTQATPPNFAPTAMPAGYTAFDASTLNGGDGIVMPTDGRTLEATTYAGAVAPGTAVTDAWYYGWTVWSTNGIDSRPVNGKPQVVKTGVINADETWTADNIYVLDGPVFAGVDVGIDGNAPGGTSVTLTIEPGTTILGLREPSNQDARGSYLVINRGSKIIADATGGVSRRPTEAEAIVFTSDAAPGSRARADWGGLVINGLAPLNTGDEAIGEGGSGLYGGTDPLDDSGILRGVRVEFAGDRVSGTDELNGIAFQGVGAGTTVDYVQVHYNEDDGTEPFGGTVSQTHMVMTGIGDDSFDGTDGYQGFMQYLIAQQRADGADNGFEISNNGDDPTASPKSSAVVANATMVGSGFGTGEIHGLGTSGDVGVLFREGSHYRLFNVIAVGFGDSGFDVEGNTTAQNADCRIGR
ncbi:MAG: fibronectin type III domain-containing protein [Gemmatimonadales bacterium]|jgi:hypothetical protein